MPPPPNETDRTLDRIEADLRQLEAEYNMYFAGRLPRPPWETRNRLHSLFRQYDRSPMANYGARFRFSTLQSRFASLVELWDRGLRAREEGRGGALGGAQAKAPARPAADRVVRIASFQDPTSEPEKLRALYDSLSEARREVGADAVSFERFKTLVSTQVEKLRGDGDREVAFRVAVHDGKVSFTAKAMKPGGEKSGEGNG